MVPSFAPATHFYSFNFRLNCSLMATQSKRWPLSAEASHWTSAGPGFMATSPGLGQGRSTSVLELEVIVSTSALQLVSPNPFFPCSSSSAKTFHFVQQRRSCSRVPLVIYDRRRLAASGHQLPLVPTGILPNQPELNGMRENRLLFGDYQQIWRSSNGFSDFSSIFSRKKNLKDVTLTEGSSSICLTKCGRK